MSDLRPKLRLLAAAALVAVVASGVAAAGPAAPAPRGSLLISSTRDAAFHDELWSLDLRTGRRVNVSRSPAADREPTLAPDGRTVAFVSDRGGAEALYASRLDGGGLRRLAGPFPEASGRSVQLHQPAWSPDGRRLLFVVTSSGRSATAAEVRIVGRGGGATTRIATSGGLEAARWSPDGRRLAVATIDSSGFRTAVHDLRGRRLWRIGGRLVDWSAHGDLALVLFVPTPSITVAGPDGKARWRTHGDHAVWSPDGRLLAVVGRGALRVLDERGRVRLRPRANLGNVSATAWLPGSRALLVSSDEGRELVRLGLDGTTSVVARRVGLPRVAVDGSLAFVMPRSIVVRRGRVARTYPMPWQIGLCHGGLPSAVLWVGSNRLLYAVGHGGQHEGDLWVVGGRTIRRLPGGADAWRGAPEWSPDGSSIAYEQGSALTHGGGCSGPDLSQIRIADASGGNVRVLTRPRINFDRNPTWSPDGRSVAFERGTIDDEAAMGILVVDVTTRSERRLTTGAQSSPSWTADGLAIVYQHGTEIRRVVAVNGLVSRLALGELPEAAPVGDLVAFLRDGALWTVRADGTGESRVAAARPVSASPSYLVGAPKPRWSPDGRRVAVPDAQGVVVVGRDGENRTLVPARSAGNVAWSPDGRTISFTAVAGNHSRGIFNTAYVARTELYTVPAGGGTPTRLTNDLANVLGAGAWRP